MRGQAGSVPEISVSGLEILPYEHFIPGTGMNGGMNSGGPDSIVLHCHIISIPFNRSDTALRVTKAEATTGSSINNFKINTTRDISKLSQILSITRGILAKNH